MVKRIRSACGPPVPICRVLPPQPQMGWRHGDPAIFNHTHNTTESHLEVPVLLPAAKADAFCVHPCVLKISYRDSTRLHRSKMANLSVSCKATYVRSSGGTLLGGGLSLQSTGIRECAAGVCAALGGGALAKWATCCTFVRFAPGRTCGCRHGDSLGWG